MAGRHVPPRKTTVFVQTPQVGDVQTRRALEVHHQAILELQSRRFLELFTATEDGYVPASGGSPGDFLAADGTWRTVVGAGAVDSVTGTAPINVTPTTGNVVVSLNDDGVTNAKLRNSTGLSVIGRSANSVGDPADIVASSDGDVLRRSGVTLGFGAIPESSVTGLVTDLAARPTGSGTNNTIVKWTGATTVGDSLLTDNATTLNYNSGKFTVVAASGNTTVAGTLESDGNFTVNTNKFIVTASSGNTSLAGQLIGGATGITKAAFTAGAEITRDASTSIISSSYGTSVTPEVMVFHGRGTGAASSALQSGDLIGQYVFTGSVTATGFVSAVLLQAFATENWALGSAGSRFELYTTANGTGTRTAHFTVQQDGGVGIGPTFTPDPSVTCHVRKSDAAGVAAANTSTVLHVESSATTYITISGADSSHKGILFARTSSNVDGSILYDDSGNTRGLLFRTGGNTTRFSIGSSGNLIGTTVGNAASGFAETWTPVAGATDALAAIAATNNGTFTTAGGALTEYAVKATISSTKSAGASTLTNIAIYGTASGGDTNVALRTDAGNILLNQTGGTFSCAGAGTFTSTLDVTGNFNVNTNKFSVVAASGNTTVAGTLDVAGNFNVNTNKFSVVAASGNTTVAGTLSVTGDFSINTNKFTVTASSGNTAIAGTLDVTGTFTSKGTSVICDGTGDTLKFYGGTGATQQTVTGSRGGNAALADLLTKLATLGLIVDGTSA